MAEDEHAPEPKGKGKKDKKDKKAKDEAEDDEGEGEYNHADYIKRLEARLPGGQRTKRVPVLKLELGTAGAHAQMSIINDKLFQMADAPPIIASREFQNWREIDVALFGDAKASYDGVIAPFKKQPRVYKLESVKEKVWESTRDKSAEIAAKAEADYQERAKKLAERKAKMAEKKLKKVQDATKAGGKISKAQQAAIDAALAMQKELEDEQTFVLPPLTQDEELETHLDPFEPPLPWKKEMYKGDLTYINDETKERLYERPNVKYKGEGEEKVEVWHEKMQMLTQLTPREDLNGYEYRETDLERRRRQRAMNDFEEAMKEEIKRREENPTDIEVVEDVLFDMVDIITKREEREILRQKKKEKALMVAKWSVICQPYKMKALPAIENEDGEIDQKVTDRDFVDMIISHTGHMLALTTPPFFYRKHENERAEARAIEEEKRRMEEYERNRPFVEKARIVMAIARHDPKTAAGTVLSGLKSRALAPLSWVAKKDNRKKVTSASKRMLIDGLLGLLKATQTPKETAAYISKRLNEFYQNTFLLDSEKDDANNEELEKLLNELSGDKKKEEVDPNAETPAQKKLREWRERQPRPVQHADCVLVTMTFLIEPPAAWKWKKPRKWKDDVEDAKEKARERASDAKWKVLPAIPPIVDNVNETFAVLGLDAIELEEESYEVPKGVTRRQAQVHHPWEIRERDEQSVRTEKDKVPSKWGAKLLGIEPVVEEAPPPPKPKPAPISSLQAAKLLDAALAASQAAEEVGSKRGTGEGQEEKKKRRKKRVEEVISDAVALAEGEEAEEPPVFRYKTQEEAYADELAAFRAQKEADEKARQEALAARHVDRFSRIDASNIYRKSLDMPISEEERQEAYLETLRIKALDENPNAYDRVSFKVPGIGKLVPEKVVSIPTAQDLKDKVRNQIRKKLEPKEYKDVMDPTEMNIFKDMLLGEISGSICLPKKNISIECIRRLDKNDPKLIALKQRNDEFNAELKRKSEEAEEERLAEQERRKQLHNPANYGEENWAIENLRDFVEDLAERKGYNKDEVVQKLGLTKEQLRLKRFDRMELTAEGKFVKPESTMSFSETMLATYGSLPGTVEFDLAYQAELMRKEEIRCTEFRSTMLSSKFATFRTKRREPKTPAEEEAVRLAEEAERQAEEDYELIFDVYAGMVDKIQVAEDDRIAAEKERVRQEAEEQTHQKVKEAFLLKFSEEPWIVDAAWDMMEEVDRRDKEEKREAQELKTMYREMLESMVPGEMELVDSFVELLDNVTSKVEYDTQQEIDEERRRVEKELFDYNNEFNWTIHEPTSEHERKIIKDIAAQEERKKVEPKRPKYFTLGLANPEDLKRDPKYHLAKALEPMSDIEKRRNRIKYLRKKQSTTLEGLELALYNMRQVKDEMIFDAKAKYDVDYEPIVNGILKPWSKALGLRVKHKAKTFASKMKEAYKNKKKALVNFLFPFKPMTQEEVDQKVLSIKYAFEKEKRDKRRAEREAAMWRETVDDEEKERRKNFRESLLLMYAGEGGVTHARDLVNCYEHMCVKVVQRIEGWENEEEDEEEDENPYEAEMVNMIDQVNTVDAAVEALEEELAAENAADARLAALEKAQAEKNSKEDPRIAEAEMHATFRRIKRKRLKEGYDPDIVDLMDKICIAVDLAEEYGEPAEDLLPQVEDDYDLEPGKAETVSEVEPSDDGMETDNGTYDEEVAIEDMQDETEDAEKEEDYKPDDSLLGCEISFMIFVTDEDRKGEMLGGLEAEDIAVMLQDMSLDPSSRLRQGYIGSTCMDVTYKTPFKKRDFPTWESFWVHIIHPVFFHYSTKKPVKGESKVSKDTRLASGLIIHNPTSEFSARQKETFLMLQKKYARKPNKIRPKGLKPGEELDPVAIRRLKEMEEKAKKKAATKSSVVDLNVDEFSEDVQKLSIIRPNMEKIDAKQVERLRRIAEAFDEKYKVEMMQGLEQPGNRLKIEQYNALKDRDCASRIYRSAKGKLNMNMRKDAALDDMLPVLDPTHIPDETFLEWIMEIRLEDEANMRAKGIRKLQQKELRAQESELRLRFSKQRYWVINYITYSVENSAALGPVIHKELMEENEKKQKALNHEISEQELRKYETKQKEFQSFVIQEEKSTRKLFEGVARWAWKFKSLGQRREAKKKIRAEKRLTTVIKPPALADTKTDDDNPSDEPDKESHAIGDHDIVHISDLIGDSDSEDEDDMSIMSAAENMNLFGDQLPFVAIADVIKFIEFFKTYRDHTNNRNKILADVFTLKQDRKDAIRREGAMVVAQAEGKVHMGATKKQIDAEVKVWADGKEAETLELHAQWDATIPREAPSGLKPEERLSAEILSYAYDCHWIAVALENGVFLDALRLLPSKEPSVFARDELIQFATIVAEVAPLLLRCQARLKREQDEYAELMGLRKKNDKEAAELAASGMNRRELREKQRLDKLAASQKDMPTMSVEQRDAMIAKKEAAMMKEGLGAEAVRRMKRMEDAKRRKGEREKAWLTAHPHRFIKYNEIDPAFCITCKVKIYEKWYEDFMKEEKEHEENFEVEILENYEDNEAGVTEEVEKRAQERLEEIKEDVLELYQYEDNKVADEARFTAQMKEYEAELRIYKKSGKKAPIKPVKRLRAAPDKAGTRVYQDRRRLVTEAPPEFVSVPIHRAKLAYVDPDGENILPDDDTGGEAVEDDEESEEEDDDNDVNSKEEKPIGVKFRVWDKSIIDSGKGVFLGQIAMGTADFLNPPSGARTYPLKTDPKIVQKAEVNVEKILGSMTVLIKVLKRDKQAGHPIRWRVEVQRCSRLAIADRLKLTSPFVEVLWCGPAIRDGTQIDYKRWLAVGETKHKNKNTDPVFDPKVDNTVFEFPPFWTDMNIPDRGWYVDGVREDYEGGAWCAQNQMPKAPIAKGYLAFGKMKRLFRKVGIVARACIKLLKGPKLEKKRQVTLELDTQRELWRAENRERLCMAREERRNRKWELEIEVNRAKPLLELQIGFEREWSNLCRNILAMPKILARLRFMMGSASDGGGIVIMTEDPATKRMLNVLSVPILYPEDEMFLTGQMGKLIGKQNTNLVGIVDFSVHAARVYNLHGFSGVDERVAIAVLERYEGVMMLDYMKKEWLHMNNDRFRSLLKQIIDGFVGLHEEDIIHRNFHPKAVIVRQPKNIFDEDPNPDKSKRYLPTQPNLRVSEYWFLQNPRQQGCEYSMGRADWGSRITAPPEALGGFLISDRSDIWAFGVCVYHWATGGRTLPPLFKIDDLAKDIPLKWGVWVHALLKMCLAQNPKVRASAKEIQKFLMKMLGN